MIVNVGQPEELAFVVGNPPGVQINSDSSQYQGGLGFWNRHSPGCCKQKEYHKDKSPPGTSLTLKLPGQMKAAEGAAAPFSWTVV